jgi:hypothetical protein
MPNASIEEVRRCAGFLTAFLKRSDWLQTLSGPANEGVVGDRRFAECCETVTKPSCRSRGTRALVFVC